MDDDREKSSFLDSIKLEWSLFWASLSEENEKKDEKEAQAVDDFEAEFAPENLERVLRSLSEQRNDLNKKLETLKKEIELGQVKLESLKLVGSDTTHLEENLQAMTEQGFHFSTALVKLDEKLKRAHEFERELA